MSSLGCYRYHPAMDGVYLERGRPVAVLTRWGRGGGPRNVLIRRDNGRLVVRPFRGLRKLAAAGSRHSAGQAPD